MKYLSFEDFCKPVHTFIYKGKLDINEVIYDCEDIFLELKDSNLIVDIIDNETQLFFRKKYTITLRYPEIYYIGSDSDTCELIDESRQRVDDYFKFKGFEKQEVLGIKNDFSYGNIDSLYE